MRKSLESLRQQFSTLDSKRVLLWGDSILDTYQWTGAERVSPEAPVLVCRLESESYVPGGAANVAANIASLGGTLSFMSQTGDDSQAETLVSLLKERGVDIDGVYACANRRSIVKTRIMANRQQMLRVDQEDILPATSTCTQHWLRCMQDKKDEFGLAIISDYKKGCTDGPFIRDYIQAAKEWGLPVIVDPKGSDFAKYSGADLITPNMSEFLSVSQADPNSESSILEEGVKLLNTYSIENLVLTRSEKGISVIQRNGEKVDIPTQKRDVIDVTGAGDTVMAALGLGLICGLDLIDAATFANHAAAVVIQKIGTATATLDEVLAEYGSHE